MLRFNRCMAVRWRMESRGAFEATLAAGLIAVDFRRDGTYVMASDED